MRTVRRVLRTLQDGDIRWYKAKNTGGTPVPQGIRHMAIIHRIWTPENDSEARAIKRFARDLPNNCFVGVMSSRVDAMRHVVADHAVCIPSW